MPDTHARDMPQRYDVCHGDADGLCAAVQWRLAKPGAVRLLTGLKSQIALLAAVPAAHAHRVNVFDLSLIPNRAALLTLLAAGVKVRWFDHHAAPDGVVHPRLEWHWQGGAQVCTSLLVDRAVGGAYGAWALVGAYGDHLADPVASLVRPFGLDATADAALRQMGVLLNYNAYGDTLADVCVPPARVYASMCRYQDPWQWARATTVLACLARQYQADHKRVCAVPRLLCGPRASVVWLPDTAWAARVRGAWANELALQEPDRAHAVLKYVAHSQSYRVSLRAPFADPRGADALCARFGGSGRAAAAGIAHLATADVPKWLDALEQAW